MAPQSVCVVSEAMCDPVILVRSNDAAAHAGRGGGGGSCGGF